MAEITFRELTKYYPIFPDGYAAAYKINLTVADGELFAFLGEQGVGKSTFLRIIAGLEEIDEGELLFDGKVVNTTPVKERNVAMITDEYALKNHRTVSKNLSYGLKIRGVDKAVIALKVAETAEKLGLKDKLNTKVKHLTVREKFLVALGRALARAPVALLLDEPLKNMTDEDKEFCLSEIKRLNRLYKITFVYATEEEGEAIKTANRTAVIDFGSIKEIR